MNQKNQFPQLSTAGGGAETHFLSLASSDLRQAGNNGLHFIALVICLKQKLVGTISSGLDQGCQFAGQTGTEEHAGSTWGCGREALTPQDRRAAFLSRSHSKKKNNK